MSKVVGLHQWASNGLKDPRPKPHPLGPEVPKPIKRAVRGIHKPGGKTHLIIGDSHSNPEIPNHRYEWLGKLVAEVRPDVVIDIGDWFDMDSLSHYDKGKKSFEGRRYWKDIEHGLDAQDRFHHKTKFLAIKPRLVRTLGNHENRITRAVEDDARLEGAIGLKDLLSKEYGWEEIPFLVPVLVDGIAYCHYFTSGVMGRAIGGEHPAHMLLKKQFHSSIQGHSHTFAYAERCSAVGKKLQAISCGCYLHHQPTYAGPANLIWRRGITILKDVTDGQFDFEWISIDRIAKQFS